MRKKKMTGKAKNVTSKKYTKEALAFQKSIGEVIRCYMNDVDISTTELAKAVGISQAQVSRLCCGLQGFRSATLYKICEALEVPPADVINEAS